MLAGPSVSRPALEWLAAALAAEGGRTGDMLTAHRYPYWAGATPGSSAYATIAGLLSDTSTVGLANTVKDYAAAAHRAGRTFRVTELGSSAGGVAGVTDTFATALWIPDALFSMMNAGVDGVHVHLRSRYSNSALNVNRKAVLARPLFYGMVLAARALGSRAQLVDAQLAQPPGADLKAWAVRVRGDVPSSAAHQPRRPRASERLSARPGIGDCAATARPTRDRDNRRNARRSVAGPGRHLAGHARRANDPPTRGPVHAHPPRPLRGTAEL